MPFRNPVLHTLKQCQALALDALPLAGGTLLHHFSAHSSTMWTNKTLKQLHFHLATIREDHRIKSQTNEAMGQTVEMKTSDSKLQN
ncbi:hypothetical protein INR49_005971, partial [Caranx melampygus]